MRTLPWALVIALACAGACVSGSMLLQHDGGWSAGTTGTASLLHLCDTPAGVGASCADVIGSRWGSFDVTLGARRIVVPTSLVGLVYFVAVIIWFGLMGWIHARERWVWAVTFLWVGGGLATSVFFLGLMGFVLSQWCPACVAAHGASVGVFLATLWLWRSARRSAASEPARIDSTLERSIQREPARLRGRLAVWSAMTAVGAAVGCWLYFDAAVEARRQWRKLSELRQAVDAMKQDRGFVLREYFAQPVHEIPWLTAPDASFSDTVPRLVVFMDDQRRSGRCFDAKRPELIDAAFPGGLLVEYRHAAPRPADPETPTDAADETSPAVKALSLCYAAEAARMQGGEEMYQRMRSMLIAQRRTGVRRDFAELAARVGCDVDRFLADMAGEPVHRRVKDDLALADALGVTETPALFLNGRRVPDLLVGSRVFWRSVSAALTPCAVLARVGPTGTTDCDASGDRP